MDLICGDEKVVIFGLQPNTLGMDIGAAGFVGAWPDTCKPVD